MNLRRTALLCTLALGAIVPLASAQRPALAGTTGMLNGFVYGAGALGSRVFLTQASVTLYDSSGTQVAVSDAHGFFAFVSVPPGVYSLRATHAGWYHCGSRVRISTDAVTTIPITMVTHITNLYCPRDVAQPSGSTRVVDLDQTGSLIPLAAVAR
jgi:hypothetical protein